MEEQHINNNYFRTTSTTNNNNGWMCKHCTLNNDDYFENCGACFIPRDEQNKSSKHISSADPYTESSFIENLNQNHEENKNEEKEYNKNTLEHSTNEWKCNLCSMMNDEHISYCEICLIPREIQQNATLLQELQTKLNSNHCDHHIKAVEIQGFIHKLKDDVRRLKMSDVQFSKEIQQEIDSIYTKTHLKCDENIVHDFIEEYNINHNHFESQKRSNKHCPPICKCGTEMISMKANAYRGISHYKYVICDICQQKLNKKDTMFHCPRKQLTRCHSDGFDICLTCTKQYIHRLRHFVAIIICPKMTKDGSNNDSEALKSMFHKLGFHTIVCLKDDAVTKQSVQNILNELLPKDGENVNQFTVICYSGHGAMDENSNYHFAIDDDPNTWIASDIIKTRCKSTAIDCAKDGFTKYFNNVWNKTYYRHNTLLLINSCFSGGYIDSQTITKSFTNGTALAILLAAFGLNLTDILRVLGAMESLTVMDSQEVLFGLLTSESTKFNIASLMKTFGLNTSALIAIAKILGISLIAVIIISFTVYKAVNKSMECESIYVIASSGKNESSYACCGVSPFIEHCNDFFNIFMDPKRPTSGYEVNGSSYLADSPSQLYEYLQSMYRVKVEKLGGESLNESGQTVCASKQGFHQFAMCPMLNRN